MGWSFEILDGHNRQLLAHFDRDEPFFWQLSSDIVIPMEFDAAWCHRCEEFVNMERLPVLASVEQRIRSFDSPQDEVKGRTRKMRQWKAVKDWLQNRKSPPRCLACGSITGIVSLADAPIDVPVSHPGDPGRTIVVGSVTHYSGPQRPIARDEQTVLYDREGNRLSQKTEV